jgi:hypothetical protein
MVQLVLNPETGAPIDAKTLRKHFRHELDSGHTKADTMVAQSLFKNATTATKAFPGGIPIAQIFWLKTRARWKPPAPDEPPQQPLTPTEQNEQDTVRRLAFLLQRGALEQPKGKKKAREPA